VRGDSLLGADDPGYGTAEHTVALDAAVASLGRRERQVLHLRFVEDLSQPEIAEHVGVSQSYVSRILQGSLTRLRLELAG
jgi:RNA polymerase sigma-B factor